MNNGKANRRLRNLWYKKDLVGWIDLKVKLKRYPKNTEARDSISKLDMSIWNSRFTHEEIQLLHYKDWHPYCCNKLAPCASRAWDRMEMKSYGWYCPFCGMKLGKHLHRIYPAYDGREKDKWNNRMGLPNFKPFSGIPMEMNEKDDRKSNAGPNTKPIMTDKIILPRRGIEVMVKQPNPPMMVSIING